MITVKWDDSSKTIVKWDIEVEYVWSEFDDAVIQTKTFMEEVPDTVVDLLVWVHPDMRLPDTSALQHFRHALVDSRPASDNAGVLAIVQRHSFIEMIVDIVSRVYHINTHTFENVRFFSNEEAAREYIRKQKQRRQNK